MAHFEFLLNAKEENAMTEQRNVFIFLHRTDLK